MDEEHDLGRKDRRPSSQRGSAPEGLDRDILPRRIVGFAGGVVVLAAAAAVTCWLLFGGFQGALVRRDPPPPALPEARARVLPPEPRLQINPTVDMDTYRAREQALLSSYGWSDREAATARIPIDRAIDLYTTGGIRAALTLRPTDGGTPDGGAADSGATPSAFPDGGAPEGGAP